MRPTRSQAPLKLITLHTYRKIEMLPLAGEILAQLTGDLTEPGMGAGAKTRRVRPVPVMTERHPAGQLPSAAKVRSPAGELAAVCL